MKFVTLVWCLLTCTLAIATTLAGQTFEDNVRLANHELQLNGVGVRAVLFIKGYVAGLYLRQKAISDQDAVDLPGAKRLQLRMLRTAKSEDFNHALSEGLRKNVSEAEWIVLSARMGSLSDAINAIGKVAAGDVINFDYVPERGTTLSLNGTAQGSVISGADFYAAVLRIFVGEHPVDGRLKNGLLGR